MRVATGRTNVTPKHLVATPPGSQGAQHLEAMEAIFGNLSQETFRRFMLQADSSKDVLVLLGEADSSQLDS